jgi:hypothetical protein
LPSARTSAVAGTWMPGALAICMRPVTVLPRRIAGGGSISRTRTAKVPVTGSARGETSRTRPTALTVGSIASATLRSYLPAPAAGPALPGVTTIFGSSGAASLMAAGTSKTASRAPSRAT